MSEDTDFLYPFIEGDERDAGALLADLAASAVAKARDERRARNARRSSANATALDAAADAMADRFAAGGRLFTFGNGGSSTDAASLAALFARPPRGRAAAGPLPRRRHRRAHRARPTTSASTSCSPASSSPTRRAGDIALGLSTSGNSRNLLAPSPRPRAAAC